MKKLSTTSPTSSADRPVDAWPVGNRVVLLDAWMRNPVEVKIIRHWNADHVGADDVTGLRYYAHVGRIERRISKELELDDFDDILGPSAATTPEDEFMDILGC